MLRISIVTILLIAPLWGQRDVRYYFNGKTRVALEEAPPDAAHAWRILGGAQILEKLRDFEKRMPVFRALGTNSDALAVIRNRPVPTATDLFFKLLVKTGQAQRLRVFRQAGKTTPLIEYPEIYLKLKPGVTAAALRQALLNKKYRPGRIQEALHGWAFLDVKVPSETLVLADDLNHMPSLVAFAEPAFQWVLSSSEAPPVPPDVPAPGTKPPDGAPNDTFFPRQWAMFQPNGIFILPVWQAPLPPSSPKIRVAVLDAPIDLTHPDLLPVLDVEHQFNATAAKPADQAKLAYNPDPSKRSDHGTACAGIIAAARGNGIGVAGVASNVTIIPVQILRQDPSVDVINTATISQGILHAFDSGADVISMSANFDAPDDFAISDALDEILNDKTRRVVFVNSTGNDPDGNTPGVALPARYASRYPFLIAVGASDLCGSLKIKSTSPSTCDHETNWKSRSDDVVGTLLAPGLDIVTTTNVQFPSDPANRRNYRKNFSGTSAAAPFAAGVVAIMLAANSGMTAAEVRDKLLRDSDEVPGTKHRRLNACKALGICAKAPGTN